MLQQTVVKAAIPYYHSFLARWPTVKDLAAAPLEDVLAAWAGLGYYRRARMLHACAQVIAHQHGGRFPDTEAALRALPGVGAYTAAAIAAIAFGRSANVVDGNVERVMARLHGVEEPLPSCKPKLRDLAALHVPEQRPGDHAQALMDLGATICTPRNPDCVMCPLHDVCRARARGIAAALPRKAPKAAKPHRAGVAFVVTHGDHVLLERRPEAGLLGGMLGFPCSPWEEGLPVLRDGWRAHAPASAEALSLLPQPVRHVFTHFSLTLHVATGQAACLTNAGLWVPKRDILAVGLPSLMQKVAKAAFLTSV